MLRIILLVFTICCASCNQKDIKIEPINETYNENNIFNYYEISNYENNSNEKLITVIDDFIKNQKIYKKSKFTALFYRKKMFVNYQNHLNEDEIDSEMGFLLNYKNENIALFYCDESNNKKFRIYTKIIYDHNTIILMKRDSTLIKGNR